MSREDAGYKQAIEHLAAQLINTISGIAERSIKTGDFADWERLENVTELGVEGMEDEQHLLKMEEIFWVVSETYDVPMDDLQDDLCAAQERILGQWVLEQIADDLRDNF